MIQWNEQTIFLIIIYIIIIIRIIYYFRKLLFDILSIDTLSPECDKECESIEVNRRISNR